MESYTRNQMNVLHKNYVQMKNAQTRQSINIFIAKSHWVLLIRQYAGKPIWSVLNVHVDFAFTGDSCEVLALPRVS